MAETDAPMFQSTRSMKREMDEILSEKQDPVSGNIAPVGATPEEVRDDIPIMASPNEFMIDAATRRYYGTAFFEGLQDAAKQGFERIKKGEESFFRDDELEVEEAAEKVTSGESPQQMQEGGEIQKLSNGGEVDEVPGSGTKIPPPMGGGYGGYGGAKRFVGYEYKTYVHPTKPELQIVFFNGRPLSPIPEGYVLKGQEVVEAIEQVTPSDNDSDPPEPPKTWANTPIEEWEKEGRGTKLWQDYANRKGVGVNAIDKFFAGAAAVAITGPGVLYSGPTLINKMESEAAKKAQSILKAAQGKLKDTSLSAEERDIYQKALDKAKAEIDYFKNKKPFSIQNFFGIGKEKEETIIKPQVITVPDDGSAPAGTDPGFVNEEGQIIKPPEKPPTPPDFVDKYAADDDDPFEEIS
jgi:hypothetical protein